MTELLDAVKGSPLLLAFLVVGGFVVYAVERLCGANGPVTLMLRAWQDRELRKLRREATLRAEQRRIEVEARSDREHDLLDQLAALRTELGEARRQLDRAHRQRVGSMPTLPVPRADDGPPTAPLRRESARRAPPGR